MRKVAGAWISARPRDDISRTLRCCASVVIAQLEIFARVFCARRKMASLSRVLVAVLLMCACWVGVARVQLGPTRQFVADDGRHVMFHGLAFAGKEAPPHMTDAQMDVLQSWGFNAIRVSVGLRAVIVFMA